MANAFLDENSRPTLTGALSSDGATPTQVFAVKTSHALEIDDNTTGSDNGNNGGNALTDDNGRPTLTALASDGSGEIVNVYVTSTNKLMVDSM